MKKLRLFAVCAALLVLAGYGLWHDRPVHIPSNPASPACAFDTSSSDWTAPTLMGDWDSFRIDATTRVR
jgi:hypothetical protein